MLPPEVPAESKAQAQPQSAPAQPAVRGRGLNFAAPWLWLLLVLASMAGLANSGWQWLAHSPAGLQWLVARLPMLGVPLRAEGLQGTLLGANGSAATLHFETAKGQEWVQIQQLRWQGLKLHWRPDPQHWLAIELKQLQAELVQVETGPRGPRPIPLPATLAWPVHLAVDQVQVQQLRVDQLQPFALVDAHSLVLTAQPGAAHQVAQWAATGYGLHWQGQAQVGNQAPYEVKGEVRITPLPRPTAKPSTTPSTSPGPATHDLGALAGSTLGSDWGAAAYVHGPLAQLQVFASLRSAGAQIAQTSTAKGQVELGASPTRTLAMATLDAQALVRPLEDWPVQAFKAQTQDLNLANFDSRLPNTLLHGQASISLRERKAPISVELDVRNAWPGLFSQGRLPVAQLRGQVQAPLPGSAPTAATSNSGLELKASALVVELAQAPGPAGRAGQVAGQVGWDGKRLSFDGKVQDLAPHLLDARAAPMTLNGPVQLLLQQVSTANSERQWQADINTRLEGRVAAAPQPVQLNTRATVREGFVQFHELQAQVGPAQAQLTAQLSRYAPQAWQLVSQGDLRQFDPRPWWPGEPGAAWRQDTTRINAHWQLDTHLPPDPTGLPPLSLLQALTGTGQLRWVDSQILGVPTQGSLNLGQVGGKNAVGAQAQPQVQVQLEATAAGNQIQLKGAGQPQGHGEADRWQGQVSASNWDGLAPWARLNPYLAKWLPRQGKTQAEFTAVGRWPKVRSEGTLSTGGLRLGEWSVGTGQAQWQLDLATGERNAPVDVQLRASEVQQGSNRVRSLQGSLRGTLAEHSIELDLIVPAALAPTAQQWLNLPRHSESQLVLKGAGQWLPLTAGAAGMARWQAALQTLELRTTPNANTPGQVWAKAQGLKGDVAFDAQGRLATVSAQPGRFELGHVFKLNWQAAQLDLRHAQPWLDFEGELQAFEPAPWLARAQPGVGWRGDLQLGVRLSIQAREQFAAQLELQRHSGDLQIVQGKDAQSLGLTQVRLDLKAQEGDWVITPVVMGKNLGEIGGSVHMRTSADQRWPAASTPVQGNVTARVANIDIWSHWIPAGWRLGGELRTQAVIGGRLGDPTYTGTLTGQGLSARNLLQGINVVDGQLQARLQGETGVIEQFTARSGDGQLSLQGTAKLGRSPTAQLQLTAQRFKLIGRVDRNLTASGRAQLLFEGDQAQVQGSFKVDEGLFDFSRATAPSLDDDVVVRGELEAAANEAATTQPRNAAPRLNLSVDLDLGEKLHVRGRGLDSDLVGQVRITNPGGRLAVNGIIRARNGTYAAYGQKLEIDRGELTFTGPLDSPRLAVRALRPNIDSRVGVQIVGTLQAPRVQLYSETAMSEQEKLSWLVLGRSSEGLARADTALLQRAAMALLAGEGEAPTDQLMKALGLTELSLRQSDTDLRDTVISVGRQLSRRWYLGYERGVNATTGTWQLVYRIAQRFTLRAQSGLENSLDLIWSWRLQEPAEATSAPSAPSTAASGAQASAPPGTDGPVRKSLPFQGR